MPVVPDHIIDYMIYKEVTSQAYYEKAYKTASWPEGRSGITIGIGYDLGHSDKKKVDKDWQGRVSDAMLTHMKKYCGVTGENAQSKLKQAKKEILIPWDIAHDVFIEVDIKEYSAKLPTILQHCDLLSDTCFGVLISLSHNRGINGYNNDGNDRYIEMVNIREHMADKEFNKIPDEIRDMNRLYTDSKGLMLRRNEEADMFEEGLNIPMA